jgi:type I restriction enzyme M protein
MTKPPEKTKVVRKLRCAVYTRKSSEEGLEQEFNSLHAQREACEAYIASQRSEGWVLVRDQYDDGGISGGTLERPGLRRLLEDIEDGLIDVVVVYKIDRLSRSLADFAKLVEVFDRNNVTFVSVNLIDGIHFDSSEEVHTLGRLYETLLREMRDAAGDSGEFYTPRPVVRFMVEVTDPKLGETILDPACGTGGFLTEAFQHLERQADTVEKRRILQEDSFFGGEAKSLPFLLSQLNLLLHGLHAPRIDPGNALRFRLAEIGEDQRVNVILTNPPFGGEEETGILNNFPEDRRTAETALLFLQLIMRRLKRAGRGRAAVVVPHGTLFGDGISARIKADLLEKFNLHTVVRLREGVFAPYTDIPANLIFFDTTGPTKDIWYYEMPLPEGRKKYSKTAPMAYEEFADCLAWWRKREPNERAWKVSAGELIQRDDQDRVVACNLDIKNPHSGEVVDHRAPAEIVDAIIAQEQRIIGIMDEIKAVLAERV